MINLESSKSSTGQQEKGKYVNREEIQHAKWQRDREKTFTAHVTDERAKTGKSHQHSVHKRNRNETMRRCPISLINWEIQEKKSTFSCHEITKSSSTTCSVSESLGWLSFAVSEGM